MPFLKNYGPDTFRANRQNWTADQDENGFMYFANTRGLLVYNGEKWRLENLPSKGHIRSMDIEGPKIYVGGLNELGFFEKNKNTYTYTSFTEHLPDSLKQFGRVWETVFHKGYVYYQTYSFVLRIKEDGSDSKIWAGWENRPWKLLLHNNHFYLNIPEKGMLVLDEKDEFVKADFSEKFLGAGTEFLISMQEGLLFENNDALEILDGENTFPFENEASEIFEEFGINTAVKMPSGDLAVATTNKGLVILDSEGRLKHHFISDNGLNNDVVRGLFVDSQGSLWCTLNVGITRIDFGSPITYLDKKNGLNGSVMDIQKFNDKLYISTNNGLFVLKNNSLKRVGNISRIVRDLDTLQNQLIVLASFDKTYVIDKDENIGIIDDSQIDNGNINQNGLHLLEDENSMAILFDDGIYQIQSNKLNGWTVNGQLKGFFNGARTILQLKEGVFWIGTTSSGVYQVTYTTDEQKRINFDTAKVMHYGTDKGVPPGYCRVFKFGDDVFIITSERNIYSYNDNKDSFQKSTDFSSYLGLKNESLYPYTGQGENIKWLKTKNSFKEQLVELDSSSKGYQAIYHPFSSAASQLKDPFTTITFHASGSNLYFGILDEIVHFDLSKQEKSLGKPSILVTEITSSTDTIQNAADSITFNDLPYNNNLLSFSYTSPNYKHSQNKQYQYKLEGFEDNWSAPSKESTKEYTSLPPGDYIFKVKALNDYFVESAEATVRFTVNPPWYWNKFSIPFYILALGLMTYLFSQWRNKNLKRKNLLLQEAIDNAVAETKRQAEEIAELYEVKNRFFSNISHELRTPLTLILGPSSDLIEDNTLKPVQKNKLTFINNNAKQLLRLINQLLDLSKLEAGKLELRASQQNIIKLVSAITESFNSMAVSRGIKLKFNSDLEELFVFYDADKMEKILVNLLSNAMKFTQKGGAVEVTVEKQETNCSIKIKDSGIGINQEQLPYIFDRFFQADNRESREHEGTGIGLSLTKELVELHGGEIQVKSKPDQGTEFLISISLGREHLEEHQLAKFKAVPKAAVEHIVAPFIVEEPSSESDADEIVLLVEDNSEMRAYIKTQLLENYSILEAENGKKGFEMAKEHVPDLIVSDVMMPKMDGTELCKRIKHEDATSHIPVILLTAKASEEDKIKGLNIQADAYLAKPFNKLELEARVRNLILNRKRLQKRFAQTTLISPKEIAVTSMEQQFLEKLIDEIEEKIGDETFGVEQLADAIHLSRSQLHRKMISITDQTPSLFIRKYRLERAKKLLEQGAGRVSDIAFQVGFSSPSYFTKCYVEAFGETPTETNK
ncbi:ATP-binding protein [Croceitalea rosinachiae]|uniref:histidine kinase n=1 Tax=Croceitalea rosinachiae TaxID=3075596 RepID=A0ABU3A832_9FLAO|nr:ATP-binding protein [Croceitalea sp. F388]MDT0606342.1 ATP-binding protein [Croceitalea sp. F388]